MPPTPPGRSGPSPELVGAVGDVAEPRWSPDGRRLAWSRSSPSAESPGAELVVDGVALAEAAPLARSGGFAWAGPNRVVVIAEGGLRTVVTDGQGTDGGFVAAAGRVAAPAVSGDRVAFVDETEDACGVVVEALDGSGARRVVSRADFAWDPAWSPDGRLLAWHEWDDPAMPWDRSRIVVASPDGSDRVVVAGGEEESVGQPRFAPAGPPRVAFVADRDGWANITLARPDGSQRRVVVAEHHEHAEPSWGPGQRSFAWSPEGARLAWCRNEDGFGRLVVAPAAGGHAVEWSRGWHHGLDWSPSGLVARRSGARTAPAIVVLSETGAQAVDAVRRVVDTAPGADAMPVDRHVEPRPVAWVGADGATVHGLLFRPSGSNAPGPLLVHLHGGPTDQARVEWSPRTQHWLARGWSVLAPNPRGSTGYGRAYAQALRGSWGALDVDDVLAGIRTAVAARWADPNRVALVGGSAGAFTALLVAWRAPELVRAVVASYPVTDLAALAATTHRFERHVCDTLVGPQATAADRYAARSPRAHAAELRVPVLVLQGDADLVVTPGQARDFCAAVRTAGGDVDLHVYPGEGHGWRKRATIVDALRRTDDFLTRRVLDR